MTTRLLTVLTVKAVIAVCKQMHCNLTHNHLLKYTIIVELNAQNHYESLFLQLHEGVSHLKRMTSVSLYND